MLDGQSISQLIAAIGALLSGAAAVWQARKMSGAARQDLRLSEPAQRNETARRRRSTALLSFLTAILVFAALGLWWPEIFDSRAKPDPVVAASSDASPTPSMSASVPPSEATRWPQNKTPGPAPTTPAAKYFNEFEITVSAGFAYDFDLERSDGVYKNSGGEDLATYHYRDFYFEANALQFQGAQQPLNSENFNAVIKVENDSMPERCQGLRKQNGNVPLSTLAEGSKICVWTWGGRWALVKIVEIGPDRKSAKIFVTSLTKT